MLNSYSKIGKINSKVLKILFKVVTDDTEYEISCTMEYMNYLKEQIKRLNKVQKLDEKFKNAKKEKDQEYYNYYMKLLFEQGENYENYKQVLSEYEHALELKEDLIRKLKKEIDIIKTLKT